MVNLQVVMLSAPTSLASIIMVIGPHHAAVTHVGGSSEVGQREHMVRQGFTRKCWSEFLCLGGYLGPPREVRGFAPRDALGRHPSADPRRWRTAGGPVAGAQLIDVYGWIPHNSSFGFLDLTPATLGVFASLDRF
jgi:hypothetical protein